MLKSRSNDAAAVNLYIGKSSSGKSYLARYHLQKYPRVLTHDPNMEVEHGAGAVLCDDPDHLLDLVYRKGPIRICWRGIATMGVKEGFEWANRAAWSGEDFAVFWDEADRYLPKGGSIPEWADKLINAGRHRRCVLFAATRRPARMNVDLRDAATRICAGKITGDNSISYMRDAIGQDAVRLKGLEKRAFLDWQEDADRVVLKKSPFP